MSGRVVLGVVDRSGAVRRIAGELAEHLGDIRVVDFGRPVELGASSPRADVLLLGPGEITEAGLRREAAWRRANPMSATIAVVARGGPPTRELNQRGLAAVREPVTVAKLETALGRVLEEMTALAREAARWDDAVPEPADEAGAHAGDADEPLDVEPTAETAGWDEEAYDDPAADGDGPWESYEPEDDLGGDGVVVELEPDAAVDEPALWDEEPHSGLGAGDSTPDAVEDAGASSGEDEAGTRVTLDAGGNGKGCVVTIASATGGCGKTFYATNLAAALAEAGHRVVLVDLDLQFGEVAVALRLQHPYSIYDGLYDSKGRPLPDEAFAAQLDDLVAHHPLGFDVIVAPKSPELADYVGAADAARVMQAITPAYDIVIVDTPPSLNEVVLTALDASDLVVVMATPDVPSLKNLRVFLDTLHRLRIPDHGVRLILNKVEKDIGLEVPQVQEAFAQKFLGLIPQSPVVSRAINAGTVAIQLAPQSPVARHLRQSMENVLPPGLLASEAPAAAPARRGWFKSVNRLRFLRRGFGARQEVTNEAV